MRSCKLLAIVAIAACGGGSEDKKDSGVFDTQMADAPGIAPMITSFVPTPATIPANTPTMITWNWTYLVEPTFPDPTCNIDHGVGAVTRGQATMVTLTAGTLFTLTCTNFAGSAQRVTVIAIPPAPPTIASFTATPTTVPSGTGTSVTFNWTYSGFPSPDPTCTIEGLGPVTPGMMTTVTLTGSRTYQLKCTNTQGTSTSQITINVDECASGTHDCQANATCVDNVNSFSCQCNSGYTGNGDVCSAQVACGAMPLCDANATCVSGTSCVCNTGYVGSGTTCTRLRLAFTTSTTGNGNLSTWVGAGANAGLAAADAVCAARATAAGLSGTYVAWMSDSINDAYCRVNGFGGKKASNCGQATLPANAGPWAQKNGLPVAPTIDRLVAPTRATYYPVTLNESGVAVPSADQIYTGTDENGVYVQTCSDWTSSSSAVRGTMGEVLGGSTAWTKAHTLDPTCDTVGHIRCMETTSGPALPSRHPTNAKKAFLTSVSGTGNLSTWADANGQFGLAAGDQICQARARYAGYANPQNFKAWLSYYFYVNASSRLVNSSFAYARPDGVVIATSRADLIDGLLAAPLDLTETNVYAAGNDDTGSVWTGSSNTGTATGYYCYAGSNGWTGGAGYYGTTGRWDLADGRWLNAILSSNSCSATQSLYCIED